MAAQIDVENVSKKRKIAEAKKAEIANAPNQNIAIGGVGSSTGNAVKDRFLSGNAPINNEQRGQLQGTPGATRPSYANMSGNGGDNVPTARSLRATGAISGDTSMGTASGESTLRSRTMGVSRGAQGNSGRPVYGNAEQDRITGVVGRADGKQQMYSAGQLSEMAKKVNSGNYFGTATGAAGGNAGGGSETNPNSKVVDKLRRKVMEGGIGSRAALEGLLGFDQNDAAAAKAEAAAAKAGSANALDMAKYQLSVRQEDRQQSADFDTRIVGMAESLYPDDPEMAGSAGMFAREVASLTGNQPGSEAATLDLFKVVQEIGAEEGFGDGWIPFMGGGNGIPSIRDMSNVTINNKTDTISWMDQGGNEQTAALGWTDVSSSQAGKLQQTMEALGLPITMINP